MTEDFINGIKKRVEESSSPLDVFLLEVLDKISDSNTNSTITVSAPNKNIAQLAERTLALNGFHVVSYNNVVSVYIQ